MRYIDADNLKKSVESWLELDKYYHPYSKGVNIPTSEVLDLIETEPTADVRENVKGEWIYKNDNIAIPTGYWECSICGKGKLLYEQNFCPNCGADMRSRLQGTEIDGMYIDISGDGTVIEQI